MRRHALGLFGVAFVIAAAALHFGGDGDEHAGATAICFRVGLLLAALWLALPQLSQIAQRMPAWLAAGVLVAGLLIAVRPRYILYLAPAVACLAALQFFGWLFKPLPNPKRLKPRADGNDPPAPPPRGRGPG